MIRRIVEIADECNMTGIKRVAFYVIAPFIGIVAYAVGLVKGCIKAISDAKK